MIGFGSEGGLEIDLASCHTVFGFALISDNFLSHVSLLILLISLLIRRFKAFTLSWSLA